MNCLIISTKPDPPNVIFYLLNDTNIHWMIQTNQKLSTVFDYSLSFTTLI